MSVCLSILNTMDESTDRVEDKKQQQYEQANKISDLNSKLVMSIKTCSLTIV